MLQYLQSEENHSGVQAGVQGGVQAGVQAKFFSSFSVI